MTTITYPRRVGKTGRPLGLLDVLSKIVETGLQRSGHWTAQRQARRLEIRRNNALRAVACDANDVRPWPMATA